MSIDRYVKTMLTVIAVALVVIAVRPWVPDGLFGALAPDAAQAQSAVPKHDITVPKSWGKLVGYSTGNLLLEASDGTMRVVDIEGRAPEYPKVKVQVRWQ